MTYSKIAKAINAKFNTAYSRNAAIGRARRLGLAGQRQGSNQPRRLKSRPPPRDKGGAESPSGPRSRGGGQSHSASTVRWPPEHTETASLRCVEVNPRHLSLVELERRDCRYPYGGDVEGEAITFCGHPRRPGSSYCAPHFHLTRGPGHPARPRRHRVALLRLVEAA